MSTYKVIQDIEAEDKLVGPLTLRQFIYAGIMFLCLYLCFIGLTKHIIVMLPMFLPIAGVTGFFAFPWGREQPTEIWALAKIRFMLIPRRRIWDQSGVKELVTITVPKKVEVNYTNGLSQFEVKSRLKALADTIDSRGWAVKNVNVNLYDQPLNGASTSDRLIGASSLPQEVSNIDVRPSDDILDEKSNPVAQQFESMIERSAQTRRQQAIQQISQAQSATPTLPPVAPTAAAPANPMPTPPQISHTFTPAATPSNDDYWFMQQGPATPGLSTHVVTPGASENADAALAPAEPTADEKALAERFRTANNSTEVSYAHLHIIQPLSVQEAAAKEAAEKAKEAAAARASAMTPKPDPAIIALASNNDLNVATIARQANKQESPDEVIISLH